MKKKLKDCKMEKMYDIKPKQNNKQIYLANIKAINKWCYNNISIKGKKYSFSEIIRAEYDELVEIAHVYNLGCKIPKNYKDFIINTLYKYRFPRKDFAEELQVTVCPYCNRNFVHSTDKRTMCDLEHFFDKETYSILAVSFYNLVPVCHSCNHAKGSKKILYSPHNRKFNKDDLLSFNFFISGLDFLYDKRQIGIEIDCSGIFKENIKKLKLREVFIGCVCSFNIHRH